MRIFRSCVIVAGVLALCGCGGGGGSDNNIVHAASDVKVNGIAAGSTFVFATIELFWSVSILRCLAFIFSTAVSAKWKS